MSHAIDNLRAAQARALAARPQTGGFAHLAETLRRAGTTHNTWHLPSCQSLYMTDDGPVIEQHTPLVTGIKDVPPFDRDALIAALRTDQSGHGTFAEFLAASWKAGVVRYEVDLIERRVTYFGCRGESYEERYPAVLVD